MKKRVSHWKKEESRENQQLILKLLNEVGPMRFNELYTKINETSKISQPTLAKHLKQLEKDGKIERYWNKNKCGDCYRIKPENRKKVEAQIQKYEAIKFIEGIPNPVYAYKEEGNKAIAAFISVPGAVNRKEMENAVTKTISTPLLKLIRSFQKNQKMAVVIMVKGKEGVKP